MKKIALAGLIIICSAVIVVSFFAPWAKAKVSVTKVAKGLVNTANTELGNSPFAGKFINELNTTTNVISSMGDIEIKTQVSGYDIPTLINKKSSNIAISLLAVLTSDAKDLDKKSLLIFLFPLLAIVCALFAILGLNNKLFIIGTAVIGAVISIGGLYNLMNMKLEGLPVQITIMNGLWQTMYGYLAIFILSLIWFIIDRKKR